jgi:ElaB/YqjD/DUF883 family membrane-anchored ribosome-binding protein
VEPIQSGVAVPQSRDSAAALQSLHFPATCSLFSSYSSFVFKQRRRNNENARSTDNGQQSNQSLILGDANRMSEFSETANDYGRKIADAASRATDYIEEKAGVVGEKLKNLQGKDLREIADEAKDYARRKPGQAILISAAAGLVLGFLLRNGRRVF